MKGVRIVAVGAMNDTSASELRFDSSPPSIFVWPWDLLGQSGSERLRQLANACIGEPILRMRIGPRSYWMVNEPEGARYVLQENAKNYKKSETYDELKHFLGNGLFTSEGDFWRRQRRLAQPAFHRERLAGLAGVMVAETERMAERWSRLAARAEPFDVAAEMTHLTLAIVGRALLSADLTSSADEMGAALTYLIDATNRRILSPVRVPLHVPTPANKRYRHAIEVLDRHVGAVIAARRKNPDAHHDLLSMLLMVRDEETGEGMSDRQLRDEVTTLVLAGHETTANALAWTWSWLSKFPYVEARLYDEFRAVLGGRAPEAADCAQLKYTSMVVQESMRHHPPVWVIEREALADDVVLGYRVPRGTIVSVAPYILHHHPAYWENPEGFDPERFTPEAVAARQRFAYLPFGGGPRICIGNAFAMMEAQIILAVLGQRFRVELAPGHRPEPELLLTLRPKGGIRAVVRERRAGSTKM